MSLRVSLSRREGKCWWPDAAQLVVDKRHRARPLRERDFVSYQLKDFTREPVCASHAVAVTSEDRDRKATKQKASIMVCHYVQLGKERIASPAWDACVGGK